jgi:hypothetical protein
MPFSMKLWQVQGKDLQEINRAALNDEQRLEDWVVKDPSILGIDVLLIGRQVTTASRGRIDLLAIDAVRKGCRAHFEAGETSPLYIRQ